MNLLTIAAGAAPKPLYLTVEKGFGSSFFVLLLYDSICDVGYISQVAMSDINLIEIFKVVILV